MLKNNSLPGKLVPKVDNIVYIAINGENIPVSNPETLNIINNRLGHDHEVVNLLSKISISETNPSVAPDNDILIDEINKAVFNIKINQSSLFEAETVLKKHYGKSISFTKATAQNCYFEEIGLSLSFTEEQIINEITLNQPFEGKTRKGLQIGDSMEKAIELYGEPLISSLTNAIWRDFMVFIKDQTITTFKLR